MRVKNVIAALSLFIKYLAMIFVIPVLVALYYRDFHSLIAFSVTVMVMFFFGLMLNSGEDKIGLVDDFKKQEALATLVLFWVSSSLIFAIPYLFYGFSPINSLFEAVSGITTTGATILNAIEGLPKGILFWRSFTHWLGGMGVLVFLIAVVPKSDTATMHLVRAESTGPKIGKLTSKLNVSARILWFTNGSSYKADKTSDSCIDNCSFFLPFLSFTNIPLSSFREHHTKKMRFCLFVPSSANRKNAKCTDNVAYALITRP